MTRSAENKFDVWCLADGPEAVMGRLTPKPLPLSAVHATSLRAEKTRERLTHLHSIIQRSLEHAEIPQRRPRDAQHPPPVPTARESPPSPLKEGGGGSYLNCMEQLVLAQFESLGRRDIMLAQMEAYAAHQGKWYMAMSNLVLRAPRKPDAGLCLSENVGLIRPHAHSNESFSEERLSDARSSPHSLLNLAWEESSDRHSLTLKENTNFSSILLNAGTLQCLSSVSRESDELKNVLDGTVVVLRQSTGVAKLLLRWETEEDREDSNLCDTKRSLSSSRDIHIVPTTFLDATKEYVESIGSQDAFPLYCNAEVGTGKALLSPSVVEDGAAEQSHIQRCSIFSPMRSPKQLVVTQPDKYPSIAGHMYRSCTPDVTWQLRFYKFTNGVLRFSKPAPDGKCLHWWTVLTANEILHVELKEGEGGIGEAKPPLCSSESCCFSVYFKRRSDYSQRRLRLCCTKQNETITWFFALRHAAQVAASLSTAAAHGH
ncbi:hypothetical protein DQ04_01531030 [Trypanosoma grayi]|uniref:hypothetical protein n=1 Tax=Trypanosoma grayi TaxID=71804 RepID=UPI0004F415F9|nr:hypothetical protein DQ04_01531030 [Trypanosoma grayi]KEG12671.1 hypothetical protein DQ04_01531030 [Trypanosoma grayi]